MKACYILFFNSIWEHVWEILVWWVVLVFIAMFPFTFRWKSFLALCVGIIWCYQKNSLSFFKIILQFCHPHCCIWVLIYLEFNCSLMWCGDILLCTIPCTPQCGWAIISNDVLNNKYFPSYFVMPFWHISETQIAVRMLEACLLG